MSLNLTIDQGNTAAKIALWRGHDLIDLAICEHLTPDMVRHFISSHTTEHLRAILYCSVSSNGRQLLPALKPLADSVMQLSSDMPLPITIRYGNPRSLGTDRIAAAVGAWATHPRRSLLVVDAGTAVTYDHVTSQGEFAGGNIAPGMAMRLEALHRFTARLPRVTVPRDLSPYHDSCFGTDTETAMILGAVYGITGAITYYRSHLPADTEVVITGGWAKELATLCDFPVSVQPDLVSTGLNEILLYQQPLTTPNT
ncbi:MAG: type III pantothenate kinase [Bacteroides sp.]|nr:type III pantothenate kinase [Bacteroides sp.]MDE6249413.1 type III pantothenate kinase [Paramuribaculum sp.]MDE7449545.1 type III pantothenate kinase [Paramuribaculum sp.]